jgi:hypothetical protein
MPSGELTNSIDQHPHKPNSTIPNGRLRLFTRKPSAPSFAKPAFGGFGVQYLDPDAAPITKADAGQSGMASLL